MNNQLYYINKYEFAKQRKALCYMKKIPLCNFSEADIPIGKIEKKFVMCRGSYLTEMYNDIMFSLINNYVTCLDSLFSQENFPLDEFKKQKISAILKKSTFTNIDEFNLESEAERSTKAELICSRIANIYNIKTEYVAPIVNNPYACIVIDFLNKDDCLLDFEEFTGEKPSVYKKDSHIKNWIEPLKISLIAKLRNENCTQENINSVIKDFVKQYLFKKYIVHDDDLCTTNMGIVHTFDYKYIKIAPMYDYERCLLPGHRTGQCEGLEEDLKYLAEYYAEILQDVIDDFTISEYNKNTIFNIISRFENNKSLANQYFNLINNSTLNVIKFAEKELKDLNMQL